MSNAIGHRVRGTPGAIYLVTRYQANAGYWIRLVEGRDTFTNREVGHEANISDGAIGRTYHVIREGQKGYADADPVPHEKPCDCPTCDPEGREPARTAWLDSEEGDVPRSSTGQDGAQTFDTLRGAIHRAAEAVKKSEGPPRV